MTNVTTRAALATPADLRAVTVRTLPEVPAGPVLTAREAAAGFIVSGPYVYAPGGPFGASWRRVR